jgi:site-specific DNA recombinase
VKGKRDKQKRVYTDDYIIVDGVHDAIVSEELWDKVSEKRKETG